MANEYVVDAHALVWFLAGNQRLGRIAQAVMRDPASSLGLPIIALAEACWAVERGRTTIPSVADLLTDVDADPRITILPLDRATLDLSITLTTIGEMHDRQVVATTMLRSRSGAPVALITRDANIAASGLVPIVW
ncbi:MAG: type II toxin-antitoxin system VapC family toxin [Dehalococcoidia bacterium]